MRYTVKSPDPEFSGEVAGVGFLNGSGQVEDSNRAALAYFARRGYSVDRTPDAPSEPVEVAADDVVVEATPVQEGPKRPAANAPKADWQAYALAIGFDEDDVAKATTKELQELTKEDEK